MHSLKNSTYPSFANLIISDDYGIHKRSEKILLESKDFQLGGFGCDSCKNLRLVS